MPPRWLEIIAVHRAWWPCKNGRLQTLLGSLRQPTPLQHQQPQHLAPCIDSPKPPSPICKQPLGPLLRRDTTVLARGEQRETLECGVRKVEPRHCDTRCSSAIGAAHCQPRVSE